MKMTLLEIVQNILSAMDSDEVNSITDTGESQQVALVVKETFDELFSDMFDPNQEGLIRLNGLSNVDRPNYLSFDDNVSRVDWVKYVDYRQPTTDQFRDVTFLPVPDFFNLVFQRPTSGDNIMLTSDPNQALPYPIYTNRFPQYYTVLENKYIAFDSFDSSYEATMHGSKTLAYGQTTVDFALTDSFIPPIPANLFPLLLSESKATCFINFKQISNSKEEQRSRRQRTKMLAHKYRLQQQQRDSYNSAIDFSRTPRRGFSK